MHRHALKGLVGLATLFISCTASAYISSEYNHSNRGFYLGGDLGYGFEYTSFDERDPFFYETGAQSGNHGFAFGIDMGYQLNQYVALELDILNLPMPANDYLHKVNEEIRYEYILGYDRTDLITQNYAYTYFGIVAKLYLPINQKLRVITKLGIGANAFGYDYVYENIYGEKDYSVDTYGAFQAGLGFAYLVNAYHEFNLMFNTILSRNIYGFDGVSSTNFVTLGYNYHFVS